MKNIIVVLILLAINQVAAQNVSRQTLSGAGNTSSGNGYTLDWTMGQIAGETLQDTNRFYTQGFQQPNEPILTPLPDFSQYCLPDIQYTCETSNNSLQCSIILEGNPVQIVNNYDKYINNDTVLLSVYANNSYQLRISSDEYVDWDGYGSPPFNVWVDWDNDGEFESNEQISMTSNLLSSKCANLANCSAGDLYYVNSYGDCNISVPIGASGYHRMRLANSGDPCNNSCSNPMIVDFMLEIQPSTPTACSGIPNPGLTQSNFGNSLGNILSAAKGDSVMLYLQNYEQVTGISYQWQSAYDSLFTVGVNNLGFQPFQNIKVANYTQFYRCKVSCSSSQGYSVPLKVLPYSDYCFSYGGGFGGNYNTYYSSIVAIGDTFLVTVTGSYLDNGYLAIGIDFDKDGSFDGGSYDVFPDNGNMDDSLSFYFVVPQYAIVGGAIMRISVTESYGVVFGSGGLCCYQPYSSIGDYPLNITCPINSPCISSNLPSQSYCVNELITVPFTPSTTIYPNNIFTAQLSDANGSFANPTTIGSMYGTTAGSITGLIPGNIPAGTGYRVRVIANSPYTEGADNGANLTINSPNFTPVIASNYTSVCVGGTVSFTTTNVGVAPPYTRQWQVSTDNITFSQATANVSGTYNAVMNTVGTYYYRLQITKSGQCAGYSNVKTVTVVPDPSVTITGSASFCGNGSTIFTAVPVYGLGTSAFYWQRQNTNGTWYNLANTSPPSYTTPNLTSVTNFRVLVTSNGPGCTNVVSNMGTVTIKPLPSLAINASQSTICEGGLTSMTAGGATTYTWSPANGLNVSTGALVQASPLVTTTYTVVGTNSTTACSNSITKTITVVPDPIVTITGATTRCLGATDTLKHTVVGGTGPVTYQWQSSSNGTSWANITGATNASYPLITSSLGTKYYRLRLNCSGAGCTSATYSNTLQITVNAAPNLVLSLNGTTSPICVGGTASLLASATGGNGTATYTWQRSTDGGLTWTSIGGTTGLTYTQSNLLVNIAYRVLANYTGLGCGSATSNVVNVVVNPDPVISITGGGTFCGSGSSTFTASTANGVGTCGIQWQELVNSVWTDINGATGSSFTCPTTSTTKSYRAARNCTGNGCGTAYSNTGMINITPLPTLSINPTSFIMCVGGSKSINVGGANTYTWSPNIGLNTNTGAAVTASPTTTTTYTVTGTSTSTGCSNSISTTITVVPDPSVSITGNTSVVLNGTTTLTAVVSGGTGTNTYQWSKGTNGTTWTSISGATTNPYTTAPLTANTYYRVYVTASGTGCNSAYSNGVLVTIVTVKQSQTKGDSNLVAITEEMLLDKGNPASISIFPNPTQDLLNVELRNLEKGTDISLRLFDATGKLVETYKAVAGANSHITQLDLGQLAIGLYSLEVRLGDSVNTYKVAKE